MVTLPSLPLDLRCPPSLLPFSFWASSQDGVLVKPKLTITVQAFPLLLSHCCSLERSGGLTC